MLRIDVLPARHGDCLWIEYGDAAAPARILVDGGPGFAYDALRARIAALAPAQRYLDLLVVTHIDGDHIEGVIRLLRDDALGLDVRAVWFNGLPQIRSVAAPVAGVPYSVVQGEYLSALIRKRGIAWNAPFGGGAVTAGVRVALPGGASASLLSPTVKELVELRLAWDSELDKAGIEPDASEEDMARLTAIRRLAPPLSFGGVGPPDIGTLAARPFKQDDAAANGSSIGMLLEYEGTRLLLLGDAFPDVVEQAITALLREEGADKLKVDLVKLPHHGSRANISPSLLDKLECGRYVVSSDGKYFRHPDAEAIARVIRHSPGPLNLLFNYRTALTSPWDDAGLKRDYSYQASYPAAGTAGLSLRLAD
jgi:hypothetical protein